MPVETRYTETWLSGPHNTNFYTRTYKAASPSAALVFVHGAAEHSGRYTDMHTTFSSEHGISVFAFDLRGFGKTALDGQHKSAGSAYGKTDWNSQLDDLEWAIEHAAAENHGIPIFLMGTSMGGGLVLGLMCEKTRAKHKALALLTGVIAGSPCVTLSTPVPKPIMWVGRTVALFKPYMVYPVRNKPEDLSRNSETNAAYLKDPLISSPGSLQSLSDMIDGGARILATNYINWPKEMPVLFLHGTADRVTSLPSAKALYDKLSAKDKSMITYPDAYHELHNEPDGVREKSMADTVSFIRSHLSQSK